MGKYCSLLFMGWPDLFLGYIFRCGSLTWGGTDKKVRMLWKISQWRGKMSFRWYIYIYIYIYDKKEHKFCDSMQYTKIPCKASHFLHNKTIWQSILIRHACNKSIACSCDRNTFIVIFVVIHGKCTIFRVSTCTNVHEGKHMVWQYSQVHKLNTTLHVPFILLF